MNLDSLPDDDNERTGSGSGPLYAPLAEELCVALSAQDASNIETPITLKQTRTRRNKTIILVTLCVALMIRYTP